MGKTVMSGGEKLVACLGAVALILGAIGWGMQLSGGLIAGSGMTNVFVWGLMIAVFAFMVGFGAGAQFVCSVIYLRGREEMKPFAQVAAAVGFACVAAAGVAILADLGAIRNMTLFLVLSVIQLVAMARGSSRVKLWAVLAGAAALVLQVVEGLLFSTQAAHAWWATPIMPVDFVAVAFMSGSALLLLVAVVRGENAATIAWLARFSAVAIGVHLLLALADLALVSVEGGPVAGGVLAALAQNALLYATELALPAIGMVVLLALGRTGKPSMCALGSLLAIAGTFAHRLMLLFPAYNAPSLYLTLSGADVVTGSYPISTGRYVDWGTAFAGATDYVPAFAEWVAALLPVGVATVVAVVVLFALRAFSNR